MALNFENRHILSSVILRIFFLCTSTSTCVNTFSHFPSFIVVYKHMATTGSIANDDVVLMLTKLPSFLYFVVSLLVLAMCNLQHAAHYQMYASMMMMYLLQAHTHTHTHAHTLYVLVVNSLRG